MSVPTAYAHQEGGSHAKKKQALYQQAVLALTNVGKASITGSVPAVKGSWMQDADEVVVGTAVLSYGGTGVPNTTSEALGDMAAIYFLQLLFQEAKVKYNDKHWYPGSGAGVFDGVYICGGHQNPQFAVVVEAKAGSSHLGTRQKRDWAKPNHPVFNPSQLVSQGTLAYLEEEIQVLIHHSSFWPSIGKALDSLYTAKSGNIIYLGVRAKYDGSYIYIPMPEFLHVV